MIDKFLKYFNINFKKTNSLFYKKNFLKGRDKS